LLRDACVACLVFVSFAAVQTGAAGQQSPTDAATDLHLEVFINGVSRKLIASFRRTPNGAFFISQDQLRNVGLIPAKQALSDDGTVRIDRLPGVRHRYDEASQSIHFDSDDSARTIQRISAQNLDDLALRPSIGTGVMVNYTLFGSWEHERSTFLPAYRGVSGLFDTRVFSPYGTVSNSSIARTGARDGYGTHTRLDTNWTYSDPESLTTYVAGDVISRGPTWSRPVRLGGLQLRKNFAMRPDLVTMPVPSLSGSAAVPSTVDVIVNNSRVYSRAVDEGPFRIDNVPVVAGPGTARIVVRDALGRETVQDTPYYASAQLLAPGLTDYSIEAGFARSHYGIESDRYGRNILASVSGRHGITDWMTVEGHAEGGGGLMNGGLGLLFNVGNTGVATAALAGSSLAGASGLLAAASFEMRLKQWTLYVRTQRTFKDYADLASISAPDLGGNFQPFHWQVRPPRAIDQISLGIPLQLAKSSLNFTFTHVVTAADNTSRIAGLSFSGPAFAGGQVFVTGYRDFDRKSLGFFAGLTKTFGAKVSASTGAQSYGGRATYALDIVRPMGDAVGDYGWRVRAAEGPSARNAAAGSYRLSSARIEAGIQQRGREADGFVQIDGAVVMMDGDVFAANRINDAFAIVDAALPNVHVSHQNRYVGKTGSSGKLLVPTLHAWVPNEIAIAPTDLPIDVDLGASRQKVVPYARSGVSIRFQPRRTIGSAIVVLSDAEGRHIPPGSTARLGNGEHEFYVGYDGEAFFENLEADNTIRVSRADGSECVASFSFRPSPGEIVRVSDVICR